MFDRQIVLEITFLLRDKCILRGGLEGRSRLCTELDQDLQSPSWMSFSPRYTEYFMKQSSFV